MKHREPQLIEQHILLRYLVDWVEINSYSWNVDGLSKHLEAFREIALPTLDCEEKKLPGKKVRTLTSSGELIEQETGEMLLLSKRPNAPFQILFSSHYDTVFPPSSSFQKAAFSDDKSRLMGPGTADMKGGIAIFLSAIHALEKSSLVDRIGWNWLLAPDEEVGSPLSKDTLQELARNAHIGLVSESCLANGHLISHRKSSLNMVLEAHGKEAHAGRDINKGINAICLLQPAISWLMTYQEKHSDVQINVGMIHGGGRLNIVPGHAQIGVNVRAQNTDAIQLFQRALQEMMDSHPQKPYSSHTLSLRPEKLFTKEVEAVFTLYKKASSQAGLSIAWEPSGGVCDGNTMAACGLPTIDTVGVVGGNTHSEKEYMEVTSLESKAKALFFFFQKPIFC